MRWVLISFIKFYERCVSPLWHGLMGPQAGCRFTPPCGRYALEAVERHGTLEGGWLSLKRVCRCHPWDKGGHDPVPPKKA